MVQFECPHCEIVNRVPMAYVGRWGKCGGCRGEVMVPTPRGMEMRRRRAQPPTEERVIEASREWLAWLRG